MARRDFLEGDLLVLVLSHEGLTDGVLSEAVEVDFVGVMADDGSRVLPAFTNAEKLSRWAAPNAPFVAMDARTVLAIFAQEGAAWDRVVVDTGTNAAFSLTTDEARRLLDEQ